MAEVKTLIAFEEEEEEEDDEEDRLDLDRR
jgi:hypothetical protein